MASPSRLPAETWGGSGPFGIIVIADVDGKLVCALDEVTVNELDNLGRIYWSSNALGVTTIQYVGATDRPLLVTQPNGFGTAFGYTPIANGSLLQAMTTTNGAGQVIEQYGYSYDLRNLLLWQTNTIGGVTSLWSYAYDLAQQLTAASQWTNGVIAHR